MGHCSNPKNHTRNAGSCTNRVIGGPCYFQIQVSSLLTVNDVYEHLCGWRSARLALVCTRVRHRRLPEHHRRHDQAVRAERTEMLQRGPSFVGRDVLEHLQGRQQTEWIHSRQNISACIVVDKVATCVGHRRSCLPRNLT